MIDWLINRAKRTPYVHLEEYMNRWWLVPYEDAGSWGTAGTVRLSWWRRPFGRLLQKLGVAVRIHEILRSDRGRHGHNHPWPFLTIILRGNGYREELFDEQGELISVKEHRRGTVLYRPASTWHRLTLIEGPVTTLFITGRKCQSWGFNMDGIHVHHSGYDESP